MPIKVTSCYDMQVLTDLDRHRIIEYASRDLRPSTEENLVPCA